MTTSGLVGPETQSPQDITAVADTSILAGATHRLSAYNRLKSWLRMPQAQAAAEAAAFRDAVSALPKNEQRLIAEAEADALRHGFSFIDFQKLKGLALKAIEDPYAGAGFEDDQTFRIAAMLALQN